jgi:hypothetical protein
LISHEVIVQLISATTTETGLRVCCEIDASLYPKGVKVTEQEMQVLNLVRAEFHGEWIYTITPNQQPPEAVIYRQALREGDRQYGLCGDVAFEQAGHAPLECVGLPWRWLRMRPKITHKPMQRSSRLASRKVGLCGQAGAILYLIENKSLFESLWRTHFWTAG